MATYYNQTPGVYRCRIVVDSETKKPAIDFAENFPWDREKKCVDTSRPLGGLQMYFLAEAYPVNENGEVVDSRGYIEQTLFGYMLVGTKEKGEKPFKSRIRNLAEIFGVAPMDIFNIPTMNADELCSKEFDILVEATEYNGKQGARVSNIAPVGKAEDFGTPQFTQKKQNLRNLDKLRQALRVDFAGEKAPVSEKPSTPARPTIPERKTVSVPPSRLSSLPPRPEQSENRWTADTIWDAWQEKFPEDVKGEKFFAELDRLNGSPIHNLAETRSDVLTALANTFELGQSAVAQDEDNMPF